MTAEAFAPPRYGEATLADVMPSVLAALEVGDDNRLGLPPAQRAVVMLVDGMGLVGLRAHAAAAPYLSAMTCRELTAGFPSTTVTSLARPRTTRWVRSPMCSPDDSRVCLSSITSEASRGPRPSMWA